MHIRLTRRLADRLDGVNVTGRYVGDVFEVSERDGEMLIAEGWASLVHVPRNGERRATTHRTSEANDSHQQDS